MLTWETTSMCVLLGKESEKATAIKYIFLIVFSVLPKFYEKMKKRPSRISAQVNLKKFNKRPLLLCAPWEGAYSNIVVFVRKRY